MTGHGSKGAVPMPRKGTGGNNTVPEPRNVIEIKRRRMNMWKTMSKIYSVMERNAS